MSLYYEKMLGFLTKLFSGGLVGSLEKVALEAITTDMESSEAKALMVKTLDPNGKLRRDVTRFTCVAYGFYLIVMSLLAFMVAFGIGDSVGAELASGMMQDLFASITGAFTVIVGASFGVNGMNSFKGH